MSRVEPTQPRFTLTDEPEGVRITIPIKRRWLFLAFSAVFLCPWAFALLATLRALLGPGKTGPPFLFLVFWLSAWVLGGASVGWACLWNLAGREVVLLRAGAIIVRHEVWGIGRSKEFDLTSVRDLRASAEPYNPWGFSSGMGLWMGAKSAAFDYGASTYRFGPGLEEAEAKTLVELIRKRLNLPQGG
jgi:hypothetical protein